MSSTYTLQADFEDIDSPELIAASLSILQKDGWEINHYNDIYLKVEKTAIEDQKAVLTLSVAKREVIIECNSDLAEQANQFIVDSFAESLHKFVSAASFDNQVRNLKHHYFMNNPLQPVEEESTQTSNPTMLNTVFSFRKSFRVTPGIILINAAIFLSRLCKI